MGQMFKGCSSLTTLDVSNWNTENVEGMHEMFFRCHSLTNLDVSNWKVDKVTNMATMFGECYALQALDVANWNTANVDNMSSMFSGCKTLTSLEVSNWDVSNVTDIHFMFGDCSSLTSLNLTSWDVTKASGGVSGIFRGCSALQTLDLSGWNTANFTGIHEMFMDCYNLSKLDISNWTFNYDTGNYMLFYDMFHDCASISKACKVTATQEAKKFLLDTAISTGMNPEYFIWEDATNNGTETFSIVGTWEMIEGDMDEWTIIFREDGTGKDSWVDEGYQGENEITYSLDWENRKLYTQVPGEESMTWEIVAYSDTEVTLRYSFDGGTAEYVFQKVS
jgi:surface protein